MHAHSHAMQRAHSKLPRSALRDRHLDGRKTKWHRRADPATTRSRHKRTARHAHPRARRAATQRLEHRSRRPSASSLVLAEEARESSASDEMRQRYGSRSARAHRREQRRCRATYHRDGARIEPQRGRHSQRRPPLSTCARGRWKGAREGAEGDARLTCCCC